MSKVIIRKTKPEYCVVESPDGERYTITTEAEFNDLRFQIGYHQESGWKVIESGCGYTGKIYSDGGIEYYYDNRIPFNASYQTNVIGVFMNKTHTYTIDEYLDQTAKYFENNK